MANNSSEIKSGIILSYVYIAVSVLAGLLYMPRMVRTLGESEYGLYGLARAIIEYLSIMGLGLQSALVRFTAKYVSTGEKDKEERLGGMFLVIYSIISVIVLLSGIVLEQNLTAFNLKLDSGETARLRILVILLAANLAFSFPMGIFGGVITAHERFTFRRAISVARELLLPVVILSFLYLGYRSIAMVAIQTVFNFTVLFLDFIYARVKLGYHPVFAGFDKNVMKEIAGYTLFIFIGEITERINNATNSTILAAVSGTTAIAIFTVGAQLFAYYLNFSSSIASFFLPRIVGMTVNNASDQAVSELFIKVGRLQLFVIALIFSGFVALGQNFIYLWMGKGFSAAYWIAVICMGPTIIGRSQSLGVQVLMARNKHQFRAIFYVFVALLDIAISIPLGMKYAGIGVAIGTAIAQLIGPCLTMNIYYARVMNLDILRYWKNILPILLGIGILAFLARCVNHLFFADNWMMLIFQMIAYAVFYALVVYVLFFNEYEKNLVRSLLNALIRRGVGKK